MKQIFKTTLLMAILTGLFMAVGYALSGQQGMLMALGIAAVSNFFMYFFSSSLVIKMQGAQPLGNHYPQVERIVRELTVQANLPMPKLYYVETPIPNAFATGRSPQHAAVAVTTGIMDILNEDELRAVLAHELGHVKHRDMLISTIAATLAGAISYLAQLAFLFGGSSDDDDGGNVFAMIASPRSFGSSDVFEHVLAGRLASAFLDSPVDRGANCSLEKIRQVGVDGGQA